MCSFIKLFIDLDLCQWDSERLVKRALKSSWVIPNVVAVFKGAIAYESFSLQRLSHWVQMGFHKGGRN